MTANAIRRRIMMSALIVVALVALIVGAVFLVSSPEPTYEGKTLSAWIEPFCRQTPTGWAAPGGSQFYEELQPVRHAILQIGTNAVPFLIAKLDQRESGLQRKLRQLLDKQPLAGLRRADPRVRRIRAVRALAVLGPTAQAAIPSLAAQLRDASVSDHVVYALSGMGSNGMRALVNQFTNVSPAVRVQITMTLLSPSAIYRGEYVGRLEANQIPAGIMIDGLAHVVRDSASPFRALAIQRLGAFGPAASNAVPALLAMLKDQSPLTRQLAVRALGEIQARPDVVVPSLRNLLGDPDVGTRMAAELALRKFGSAARAEP